VTALAPSALEAEWLSKAALLSGPSRARNWLTHGGVIVGDDGTFDVIEAGSWR
jgi:thiamine biosynthesis lipoprotein